MLQIEEKLKIGLIIYNEQPRWFDTDYHPQIIIAINKNTIEVFEEGIGKKFIINKSALRLMDQNIIH